MRHDATDPAWLRELTPEEREEAAAVIEALAMHRRLMAPLIAEKNRLRGMARTRRWRAGAQAHAA